MTNETHLLAVVCTHAAAGAPVVLVVEGKPVNTTDSGETHLCGPCSTMPPEVFPRAGLTTLCLGCMADRQQGVG